MAGPWGFGDRSKVVPWLSIGVPWRIHGGSVVSPRAVNSGSMVVPWWVRGGSGVIPWSTHAAPMLCPRWVHGGFTDVRGDAKMHE